MANPAVNEIYFISGDGMQHVTEMAVARLKTDALFSAEPDALQTSVPLPWFALQIRQHGRVFCEQMLNHAGFEFFSPCRSEQHIWSDRTKLVEVPLFPGYIFCRFDPARRLPILQIPGVIGVVSAGRRLLEIDQHEVAAVRRALATSLPVTAIPYLVLGERVMIKSGPLAGLEGIVERHKAKSRLMLSVSMLNRSVCVELDQEEVQ